MAYLMVYTWMSALYFLLRVCNYGGQRSPTDSYNNNISTSHTHIAFRGSLNGLVAGLVEHWVWNEDHALYGEQDLQEAGLARVPLLCGVPSMPCPQKAETHFTISVQVGVEPETEKGGGQRSKSTKGQCL